MEQNKIRHTYANVVTIASIVLALLVMGSWVTHQIALIRMLPSSSPMQFNTALCFLLCSISLLTMEQNRRLAHGLAGFCGIFVVITGLQYITGSNYGIDTFFVQPFTSIRTTHIGRMAPNTAIAFLLLNLSLLLSGYKASQHRIALLAVLCASLSWALGIVPLLGYISGVEAADGWENFARMAIHTATLLTLLSSAVIVRIWEKVGSTLIWLPLPVAIGLTVVAVSMAHAVRSQEHADTQALLQTTIQHIANENLGELDNIDQALGRIANRWKVAGGTNRFLWERDATAYTNDFNFLLQLTRTDLQGHPLWQVTQPAQKNTALIPEQEAQYKAALARARTTHHSVYGGLITLPDHSSGLLRIHPLVHGDSEDGFLVAVIRLDTLFATTAKVFLTEPAMISVREGAHEFYSSPLLGVDEDHWKKTIVTHSDSPTDWTWTITPTADMLYAHRSRMPWVVLGMGMLTTFLVTTSLYLLLRKRQDAIRLKEGKARLRAVFTHAADGITLIDERGCIEEFNPACEQLFGYSKEEVMGKNVKCLMPEPYHREHDGYLKHYQETGEKRIIGSGREVQGKHKNGSIFDIDLRISELSLPGRKLYVGMFHDITERKRAESTQRQLIDKLAESNTELERFAYVASHDLREPLRIVANFATLLQNEYGITLDEMGQQYLALINESASRMHSMVGDLLEYARIGNEEKRFVAVDMGVELRHVMENLAVFITEHRATITSDPLPVVQGNPVQLMRLIQNLVGNSIKFHAADILPEVHVGVRDTGKFWEFTVRDNGIGMDPQYTHQIFEPFRQLHARNEYMGTGIGLAICKRIIEKHRGKIRVTSEPDQGSCFYFTIPKQPVADQGVPQPKHS